MVNIKKMKSITELMREFDIPEDRIEIDIKHNVDRAHISYDFPNLLPNDKDVYSKLLIKYLKLFREDIEEGNFPNPEYRVDNEWLPKQCYIPCALDMFIRYLSEELLLVYEFDTLTYEEYEYYTENPNYTEHIFIDKDMERKIEKETGVKISFTPYNSVENLILYHINVAKNVYIIKK